MNTPIRPGQMYRSVTHPERIIRIRSFSSYSYPEQVMVVTVTPDGRELRTRGLRAADLHDSWTTKYGQPRRTGYVLIPS